MGDLKNYNSSNNVSLYYPSKAVKNPGTYVQK